MQASVLGEQDAAIYAYYLAVGEGRLQGLLGTRKKMELWFFESHRVIVMSLQSRLFNLLQTNDLIHPYVVVFGRHFINELEVEADTDSFYF